MTLGSGNSVTFGFNNSEVNRLYRLGYNNPFWTTDGISRGFNFTWNETEPGARQNYVIRFKSRVASAGVNFGIPITEYNT